MRTYKVSAITLCSLLAITGCPSDDTAGDTAASDTDATTGPTSGPSTTPGTDTVDETDTVDPDSSGTVGDSATDTDDTATDTVGDGGVVRVVHGSPGAPAVDIWVMGDEAPVIEGLAYGESSDYLDLPAGDYILEVRVAGDAADVDPVYSTDALTIASGDSFTAIAAGQVGGDGEAAFRVLALADGFGDPGEGALVRIVHAGADAPAVDIDIGNDDSAELEGVERYADSGAEGVAIPADEALQVGILAAGEPVTAFTTPPVPAGAAVYVIATGLLADMPRTETGFSLLAVGPTGVLLNIQQNPRVYALHAGPDAGPVDICVDGAPLLAGVEFGQMGGVQVAPGEYTLDVHLDAEDDCAGDLAISATTPALAAGGQYLGIAAGEATVEGSDPALGLRFYAEGFTLDADPGDAVVRVIHAASAPSVNVGLVADTSATVIPSADVLVTGLAHGAQNSRDILITEDAVVVGIGDAADDTGDRDIAANFAVAAPDGVRAWVVATGALNPDGEEPALALHAILTGPDAWTLLGPIPGVVPAE